MNFSRRDFVKIGGLAAISTLGLSNFAFGQKQSNFFEQSSKSLHQMIGSDFYFSNDDLSTNATLTNIKDFSGNTNTVQSFSMEFQIPLKRIKEGTYRVWHSDLGNFELFCTEGRNGKSRTLLATICRI